MAATKELRSVQQLMKGYGLKPDDSYHRADLILKSYRKVVWTTEEGFEEIRARAFEYGSRSLAAGLRYLSDFAPDIEKDRFGDRLSCKIETTEMVQLVDKALLKVKTYPQLGETYYSILTKKYIVAYPYQEDELLESLDMTASVMYRRRKEAVYLFALCLFGCTIPELLKSYCNPESLKAVST